MSKDKLTNSKTLVNESLTELNLYKTIVETTPSGLDLTTKYYEMKDQFGIKFAQVEKELGNDENRVIEKTNNSLIKMRIVKTDKTQKVEYSSRVFDVYNVYIIECRW